MFIIKLYYWVWSDGIKKMQERFPKSKSDQLFWTMLIMVLTFSCFSMIFYAIVTYYIGFSWPKLNLFKIEFLEKTLSAFVFFMLPWLVVHYYLVFWKNKYQNFLPKYKYCNGKLFFNCFLCMTFLPLFLLIIGVILANMM